MCLLNWGFHLTKCFRATAGALVSQVVRRARATASARALDRANWGLTGDTRKIFVSKDRRRVQLGARLDKL